ncbi:NF-kappa-B inhibitor-like protein 1 [Pseudophryne corroboree]|uniref:NF-kappa-B inhibitor-like protein 1 n=1 Tax=Pseudophryne corroboree TaxID=495146 RepID=UPI00308207E8
MADTSFRRELRALRYVQRGDVLRLKSYIRRHRHLQLDQPLPGGRSLLHAACSRCDDACVLLLLRKGADPMQTDGAGNTALHIVAREVEKGEWRVYTDLVVPILKRCPQSMDAPNHQGITPRSILRLAEDCMQRNSQHNPPTSEAQTGAPSTDWRDKLLAESMDEYQESYGQYEEDYSDPVIETETFETFESWADRIYREHQARRRQSERPRAKTKRVFTEETSGAEEEQRHVESQQRMEKELRQAQSERYQRKCQEFFQGAGATVDTDLQHGSSGGKRTMKDAAPESESGDASVENTVVGTGMRLLGYSDIPWPVLGGTAKQMAQAIAAGADSSDATSYKRYLRAQRVTWHPDRFMQRCGTRLHAKDRERVLETVTALSQELNRLTELAQ